ncbi:DUF1846 family protein, partial [Candidatus Gracilibacteria bacterium]|nr:DUF1846 family protein [Candidatus Gracilibacteria bacterium]
FENNLHIKPKLVINRVDNKNVIKIDEVKKEFEKLGYEVFRRYKIEGYPEKLDNILSNNGFGKDDYVKTKKDLVLVTGIASSSGKMSTCLGQIYLDYINGIESGYAKYETFPIWNIELNHPINLAYEAATADIGDYNAYDDLYEKKTGNKSVNYNRDIEAFSIIKSISSKFLSKDNYMGTYDSPIEMGISNAGFCIIEDKVCSEASLEEIRRRKIWYQEMFNRGDGDNSWVEKCIDLEKNAIKYIKNKI